MGDEKKLQPTLPYLLLPTDAIKASKDARLHTPSDANVGIYHVREAFELSHDEFAICSGTVQNAERVLPTPTSLDFFGALVYLPPDTMKSLGNSGRTVSTVRKRLH